tara:strand:+ start:13508 stop:14761 length:1254 start_codon:yes stop_codon:yes gene_type:complete
MKAHPKSEFFIYSGTVYYNNRGVQTGQFQSASANPGNIWMSDAGCINLYEYNIDRLSGSDGNPNPLIYPFVIKDGSRASFSIDGTETAEDFYSAEYGDLILGYYPQTASIRREFITTPSGSRCHGTYTHKTLCNHNMSYWSLRTMLEHYGTMSPHYLVSSSYGADDSEDGWNKDEQELNLIHIPSIFYGSKIRPGTVSLQWYFTGSLIAELKDERENGELIQVGPYGNNGSGSVAGVVLYNEGFILLTGSWTLAGDSLSLVDKSESVSVRKPRWKYWGAGVRDGNSYKTDAVGNQSLLTASFGLSFEGVTKTETLTMYARAPRGKVNYSNNPTFLQYDQEQLTFTSSHVYEENKNRLIKNTVSSSYTNYEEDFKRQVYISKVAVYDDKKQLIGIATLSNPVLKEEEQDLAIKIKLDI